AALPCAVEINERISETFGKNLQALSAFLKIGSSTSGFIPPNVSCQSGSMGATSSLCSTPNRNSHCLIRSSEAKRSCVLDCEVTPSLVSIGYLSRLEDRAV